MNKSNVITFPVPTENALNKNMAQRLGIYRRCPNPKCTVITESRLCRLLPLVPCPSCKDYHYRDFVPLINVPKGEVVPLFPAHVPRFRACPSDTCGYIMSQIEIERTRLTTCPMCRRRNLSDFVRC